MGIKTLKIKCRIYLIFFLYITLVQASRYIY